MVAIHKIYLLNVQYRCSGAALNVKYTCVIGHTNLWSSSEKFAHKRRPTYKINLTVAGYLFLCGLQFKVFKVFHCQKNLILSNNLLILVLGTC